MTKSCSTKLSKSQLHREIIATLVAAGRELWASEVAQKLYKRTQKRAKPLCVSDAEARTALNDLAENGRIEAHTAVRWIVAARGRRAVTTYSAKK